MIFEAYAQLDTLKKYFNYVDALRFDCK